jgi:hypothetical protein
MDICAVLRGLALGAALIAAGPAFAQSCTADDLGTAVDQAGARLRDIMATNQPKIDTRIKALAARRGWPEAVATEQALIAIADARIDDLDRTANELLARIDTLGAAAPNAAPECGRIQEVEASSLELQAAIRAKSNYVMARLDAAIAEAPKVAEAKPADEKPVDQKITIPPLIEPPKTPPVGTAPVPSKPRAADPPWNTTTTVDAPPVAQSAPAPVVQLPPSQPPADEGYTRDEIVRASSGFFGQVSAQIAAAVERSFSAAGRPTGYILGEEGGGAFLAGLRYGKGTLYLRSGGSVPVFWHGPSLGVDVGAAGSKVMFLVYRLRDVEELLPTFSSLDGQAYVAGGVGVTLMSNGRVQMAPFRAGVGLRLGASVGYVRFTRRPTWNPF